MQDGQPKQHHNRKVKTNLHPLEGGVTVETNLNSEYVEAMAQLQSKIEAAIREANAYYSSPTFWRAVEAAKQEFMSEE